MNGWLVVFAAGLLAAFDPRANGWGESERTGRVAALLAVGGGATAVVSLLLAGAAGEPYLEADGVNGWLVVFAAGLLPPGRVPLRDRASPPRALRGP